MEISRGSIVLKRITRGDIELIRQWRNSPQVNLFMEYRGYITPAMQGQWFERINNEFNLYFTITVGGEPVGLIYGAEINWQENTVGNAGIFIADEKNRERNFALEASVLLNDFAFSIGLERILIKILSGNKKAIAYNKLFGYQLIEGQQAHNNQKYHLTKEAYRISRRKIALFLTDEGTLNVRFQPGDPPESVSRWQRATVSDD
jgi:RimJ/RimL family protein N-acetyltransferase